MTDVEIQARVAWLQRIHAQLRGYSVTTAREVGEDTDKLYGLRPDTVFALGGAMGAADKACALLGREIDELLKTPA